MREAAQLIAAQQDGTHQSQFERVVALAVSLAGHVHAFYRRRRTLARLEALDDYMLADIGLVRADLEAEAKRGAFGASDPRFGEIARRGREERWL